VLEMTPKTVAFRRGEDGLCVCTNHFRTKELAMLPLCRRYNVLSRNSAPLETLEVVDVAKLLDDVNQGRMTVQTMIFEPKPLVLHLAIGACPASAQPMRRLDVKPLLARDAKPAVADKTPAAAGSR
jgi:isopenicillin-N N-acyltransferase like protein